ncbi:hypothetical protein GMD78_05225 [Ornithinibacillus sp. L9]|uniref:Uncharacterized protein n=1 Tax=Ornithinibacillus caprae TaxID=2678566 RepID=A0A6N8FDR5_9BACI|nr:hypothetical protein [Ornithinibacillus caprae]MUK87802.1 hypothetical protein [Ornithinibacillus caprae]
MFLEMINDFANEFSPLYLYVSAVLSIFYLNRFYNGVHHSVWENHLHIRKWHEIQIQLLPNQIMIPRLIEFRNWIAIKTKRIEAPDDDTDADSFSLFQAMKLRGGKQWRKHPYSLSFENIALF